jgi:hypothetical protein
MLWYVLIICPLMIWCTVHGGFDKAHYTQQLVVDSDDENDKSSDDDSNPLDGVSALEQQFLESLSKKEMKLLLKQYKKDAKKVIIQLLSPSTPHPPIHRLHHCSHAMLNHFLV